MENFILEFKDVLSAEVCAAMIAKFERSPHLLPGQTGHGVDVSKKDSTDLTISIHKEWREECRLIQQLIESATIQYARSFPFLITGAVSPSIQDPTTKQPRSISHEELSQLSDDNIGHFTKRIFEHDQINLQKYKRGNGGYHHWHSEHYPHPTNTQQPSLRRVLLWLIYLNSVEEGGETDFYYQQARIKPTRGSLILAPCTFTHTHRGSIPISEDKFVLASWVNYKHAEDLYG